MKTIDDLKRELLSHIPEREHYTAHWLINHLHAQGRIVPDGHVAVLKNKEFDGKQFCIVGEIYVSTQDISLELFVRDYPAQIADAQKDGV